MTKATMVFSQDALKVNQEQSLVQGRPHTYPEPPNNTGGRQVPDWDLGGSGYDTVAQANTHTMS